MLAAISLAQRRALARENLKWPLGLAPVPKDQWPPHDCARHGNAPVECWRSRSFLAMVYAEPGGIERLSILRTAMSGDRWVDGITWDNLQRLKAECGRGDRCAVEIFPADADLVNVANIRHLWVLPEPPPFAWRKKVSP
jgi:hypothetical protein